MSGRAFGVFLYEVASLGDTPFRGLSATEVLHHHRAGELHFSACSSRIALQPPAGPISQGHTAAGKQLTFPADASPHARTLQQYGLPCRRVAPDSAGGSHRSALQCGSAMLGGARGESP